MKKIIRCVISAILIVSLSISSVFAAAVPAPDSMSDSTTDVEIITFEDGSYMKIVTIKSNPDARASITDVERSYTYLNSSDDKIFVYTLYGRFEYDGTTCTATDVAYSYHIYWFGWRLVDHLEYCSSNSVYGAARFDGPDESKTMAGSITCDKNGNLV